MKVRNLLYPVGRRGAFLIFLAMLDWVYGLALLYPSPQSLTNPTYVFLNRIFPLPVWASLWIIVGTLCFAFAFRVNDAIGYAAAMFIKVLWGLTFLLGWIFAGVERGYLSAAIWLAFAGLLALVATWPDEYKAHGIASDE